MPTNPQQIGPYRVDGVLGRGNMGIVFRGTHTESQQRVAIKTVQVASTLQQSSIRREVHSLSRLSHPGVVSIVDRGSIDAVPWYAMVLLEGKTLQSYIRTIHLRESAFGVVDPTLTLGGADSDEWATQPRPGTATLPPRLGADGRVDEVWLPDAVEAGSGLRPMPRFAYSVRVARRLMSTLAHVHSFGLVHRDIKPANIFLVGEDEPVLVDFGLSHGGATGVSREAFAAINPGAGTPAYMSPEVIRGYGIDARADIYAAGCVIFELFAGRPPFVGGTVTAILSQHMTREAPRLSDLADGVPPALDEALALMLHKDRRHRLGSAAEAASVFLSLEEGDVDDRYVEPIGRPPLYRPRLVGRTGHLSSLKQDLSTAIDGSGILRVVLGRSGSGKTYLVREAVARAGQGSIVVPGRCAVRGAPLHPLADLLEHVADVAAGEQITDLLQRFGAILGPFNERIAALPQRDGWAEPAVLEGAALRERLVSAVVETLVAMAQVQPTWLLIDDLQWADGLTLAVLQRLGSIDLSDVSLAVVCTCRSEAPPSAVRAVLDVAQVLALEGIDADAVVEIVEDMLGTDHPPARLVEHLIRSSDGSPFFVAEYLRAAHAVGALAESEDLTSLPDSLQALILRRLDTLDAVSRELVDLASVFGRSLDEAVLGRASALDDESLSEVLSTLERLQILDSASDGELMMAHDQLQHAAYAALSQSRRSELHLRVAQAIESVHRDHLEPNYRRLARHYGVAADTDAALKYERLDAE
ncbi:MAG: serine/threonine-protein kinase PknK, partial [Myxococcota bacterium]